MGNQVVIFNCDDWVAAYVNGTLWQENHNLLQEETITLGIIGQSWDNIKQYYEVDSSEDLPTFPENLSEVNMDLFERQ